MQGLILYTIEADDCLNGVYTNDGHATPGTICNEIAKRRPGTGRGDRLEGIYECVFFENTVSHSLLLTINKRGRTYEFTWGDPAAPNFEGIGYIMNDRQVVVRYWD